MANPTTVVVDLSNYKDKVGDRVPEGRYRVTVKDTDTDKASSGNTMITLWLEILDGEEKGLTIVDRLVLTEKSLFRVVGFMKALGLPTPKKRLSVNTAAWVGKVLEIDVSDGDPYKGSVKSEVRGYNRSKRAETPAEEADLPDEDSSDGLEEFVPEKGSPEATAAPTADANVPETVDLDSLDL